MSIRTAIIGFGKIARDQHVPAIAGDPRFELVAVATRSGDPGAGVPCFPDFDALIGEMRGSVDAVAICTPPGVRHAIAKAAIEAGLAVLLEKPPAATLGEIEDLEARARAAGTPLFAAWHSQHAPAVAPAADLLAGATVTRLSITWHEDVRKWHPGQDWVWEPSGFGVFDPGINALSIASRILPDRLFVRESVLQVPGNRQTPIAAEIAFVGDAMHASLDWRQDGGECWTIEVATADGRTIRLEQGGSRLSVDGVDQPIADQGEYPALYARFAEIVAARAVEVDREPLRIVADALLVARRDAVAPFMWTGQD